MEISMHDQLVARMLAARLNLSLVFTDLKTFATDGKTIFLPKQLLSDIDRLTETALTKAQRNKAGGEELSTREFHETHQAIFRDVLLGALAHEAAGHVRLTDFTVRPQGELPRSILSLLEDIRIEREIPVIFPGSRRLLEQVVQHMADPLFWLPRRNENPINLIAFWLMRRLRKEVLSQGNVLSEETLERLAKQITKIPGGMAAAEKCYAIANEATRKARSTGDLLQPAEQIAAILASLTTQGEEAEPEQASAAGDSSEQDQEPRQQGSSAENRDGDNSPQDGKGDSGQGDGAENADQGQGAVGQGEPSPDRSAAGQSGDGESQDQADESSASRGAIAAPSRAQLSADAQWVYDHSSIKGLDLADAISSEDKGRIDVEPDIGQIAGPNIAMPLRGSMDAQQYARGAKLSSHLRNGLRELLRALLDDEDDDDEKFGRFNARHAALAIKGLRQDVFTMEGEQAPGIDAHVVLLIDKSGSMKQYEDGVRSITYGIIDALGTIPEVHLDILYYDGGTVLAPKSPLQQREFAKKYSAGGGTNWPGAFNEAFKIFALSKRSRKILFTVTDGDVSMNCMTSYVIEQLKIEPHFLVIGSRSCLPIDVREKYRCENVTPDGDAWKLGKTILSMLKDAMNPLCV